ncbi:MAG: c-type cytochrome [Rhodothermales bacterium]
MKGSRRLAFVAGLIALVFVIAPAAAQNAAPPSKWAPDFPLWAALWNPDFPREPTNEEPYHVPNSSETYTMKHARNLFFSPDWHPDHHPALPDVVLNGRQPEVWACGSCHRAEGTGGPENAPIAGQPAAYIVQQMADFKSGARMFSAPQRKPIHDMTQIGRAITDEEVQAAAAYFSALKLEPILKVVEAETIPKTVIAGLVYAKDPAGGTEPLGDRIVEMPDNLKQFEMRDSGSHFTVYVPVGSLAKGGLLVTGGAPGGVPCATCHGADLRGMGPVPGIAGRSPSYMMRQLMDFKTGARAGTWSPLMKPQIEHLSIDDMTAVVAYLASLTP